MPGVTINVQCAGCGAVIPFTFPAAPLLEAEETRNQPAKPPAPQPILYNVRCPKCNTITQVRK